MAETHHPDCPYLIGEGRCRCIPCTSCDQGTVRESRDHGRYTFDRPCSVCEGTTWVIRAARRQADRRKG